LFFVVDAKLRAFDALVKGFSPKRKRKIPKRGGRFPLPMFSPSNDSPINDSLLRCNANPFVLITQNHLS
jgi:hypothetical protein